MLLVNPTAEYTLFDLGEHLYSKPCLEYIRSLFPTTKIRMFWGDSRKTMVEYLSNPSHQTFDCIHIDGGHTPEVFEKDWVNSYSLAKDNAIIIFNISLLLYKFLYLFILELIILFNPLY